MNFHSEEEKSFGKDFHGILRKYQGPDKKKNWMLCLLLSLGESLHLMSSEFFYFKNYTNIFLQFSF